MIQSSQEAVAAGFLLVPMLSGPTPSGRSACGCAGDNVRRLCKLPLALIELFWAAHVFKKRLGPVSGEKRSPFFERAVSIYRFFYALNRCSSGKAG